MDQCPIEVIIHVLDFLEAKDVTRLQCLSRRYLHIGRDNRAWKQLCFENSRAEADRRRLDLLAAQDASIVSLRDAIATAPLASTGLATLTSANAESVRVRALANWDPGYPSAQLDFYAEYIQRHAPISLRFLQSVQKRQGSDAEPLESVGVALFDDGSTGHQRLVSPLEDGSISIYDVGAASYAAPGAARLVHRSRPGLLHHVVATRQGDVLQNHKADTEANDNVAVDHVNKRAYVATADWLDEIDLNTMQLCQRHHFPGSIAVLSSVQTGIPLTVGTSSTLHLFDPRDSARRVGTKTSRTRLELIAGCEDRHQSSAAYSTRTAHLSQPGPTSIAHGAVSSAAHTIHVAGRFTSILEYDRRRWPDLTGTIFSGARLSCLVSAPHPYIPRSLDLLRQPSATLSSLENAKRGPGRTLVACGEYKGKGSLELYGISPGAPRQTRNTSADDFYRNRQTAAKSRLLSVAMHGARMVFSDGDGNLKWVERDAVSAVRSFNINSDADCVSRSGAGSNVRLEGGLFGAGSGEDGGPSDIVRKIVPRLVSDDSTGGLTRGGLIVWTAEGRLGLVDFGTEGSSYEADRESELSQAAGDAEQQSRELQERQYGQRMREALERQAHETRFVRGLGLGYSGL